jgi:anti-sigma B factor antagonist
VSGEQPVEFRVDERRSGETVVLELHGELDLVSVEMVTARLDELRATGEPTLLDLDSLDFMDSSGLRMLLNAAEASDATGWRFALTPGPEHVQRLFASTLVTDRLPIVPRPD